MKGWSPERVAQAAGATLISQAAGASLISQAAGATLISQAAAMPGPRRAVIDSREAGPEALFVGLPGAQVDGGAFAVDALARGAWGVLTTPDHAEAVRSARDGVLMAAADPLAALQRLANAWRVELGAPVIGVTGSTGKTSTKDLLLALLAPQRRTVASRANFNTEIGLPLEILAAPVGTEVLVLEMAMRGAGQIAELAQIAEPTVGVIVSVGPVHLELMGTIEAVAAAKAELIAGLKPGGTAIVPAGEELLEPYYRDDVRTIRFGDGGDISFLDATEDRVRIAFDGAELTLDLSFSQAHLRRNLLAAVAAAEAVGVRPEGQVEFTPSPGRGGRTRLAGDVILIDDCYNANPMSMRAALDDLAATAGRGGERRRVAVLGDMLELGPAELRFHEDVGAYASTAGVDVLVTVGPLAAAMSNRFDGESHSVADAADAAAVVSELLEARDVVLVKGSRGVGLERVCQALANEVPA
jgi:UDP-N-acetylmuramoyl-tripeptide--D-alanyl-D-alanine ligase